MDLIYDTETSSGVVSQKAIESVAVATLSEQKVLGEISDREILSWVHTKIVPPAFSGNGFYRLPRVEGGLIRIVARPDLGDIFIWEPTKRQDIQSGFRNLERVLSGFGTDPSQLGFVEFGSGDARVSMNAVGLHGFRKAIGIEMDETLSRVSRANVERVQKECGIGLPVEIVQENFFGERVQEIIGAVDHKVIYMYDVPSRVIRTIEYLMGNQLIGPGDFLLLPEKYSSIGRYLKDTGLVQIADGVLTM